MGHPPELKIPVPVRILVSSLSSKIALYQKIVEGVKRISPDAVVLGADCDADCEGAKTLESKNFLVMKRLEEYSSQEICDFLSAHQISHLIPTRDGELSFWAQNRKNLKQKNIEVMVSKPNVIDLCEDKLEFYNRTKILEINSIQTESSPENIQKKTFVVKERYGSGSNTIGINLKQNEALEHAQKLKTPIFQPYIPGKEFSAETWIDRNGTSHGILLRWRTRVIDGESHESITFKNKDWEKNIKLLFESIPGLHGHCLAQVIVSSGGSLQLVEINPRLGGATPLALSAGLHSIDWFLLESMNQSHLIPETPNFQEGVQLIKKNKIVSISASPTTPNNFH